MLRYRVVSYRFELIQQGACRRCSGCLKPGFTYEFDWCWWCSTACHDYCQIFVNESTGTDYGLYLCPDCARTD